MTAEDDFGRQVRARREAHGWTQAELAKRLGENGLHLHQTAVAKIELRDVAKPRTITFNEATALAHLLEIDLDVVAAKNARRQMVDEVRALLDRITEAPEE